MEHRESLREVRYTVSDLTGEEIPATHELARLVERLVAPESWQLLGPGPAPLSRVKGVWRWHVLVKAPFGDDGSAPVGAALKSVKRADGVALAADVDPTDLL